MVSLTRLLDGLDRLTSVTFGRWSWFQIAWTLLHVAAFVMHAASVLRRVRR